MFDELNRYQQNGHFHFRQHESLRLFCNAPTDKSGVYLVYALAKGKMELIYIGRSGKLKKDGSIFVRKSGIGGIKDRIVNGFQFGKIPRRISWPTQMNIDNIDTLNVHWYITHGDDYNDCPRVLENALLNRFVEIYGVLPRWNRVL
ncbi:MAG: hypothetical protein WCR52_05180 [Bacteroidota bacterium]